jgi:rhodanese-related sulfurtransferase
MKSQFLALALLCFSLPARAAIINVDNAELARLAASGVAVIDIRTEKEWQQSGVIAGSRLLTYFDENGGSNPPLWLEKVKAYAKANQPVIVICRSGNRSRAAAQFLSEQAGYKTVYNAGKGLSAWTAEGRPTIPAVIPGR